MSEIKNVGTKRSRAIFVISTAIILTLGISSLMLYMRTDSLQIEVSDLQKNNESFQTLNLNLETKVSNLTDEKDSLHKMIDDLEVDKTNLQSQINSLTEENDNLYSEVDSLKEKKTELQSQVDALTQNVTELQSQVDTLTQNNTELQGQIDGLMEEIDDLEWEIWDLEWQIYLLEEPQLHKVDTSWYWFTSTNEVWYSGSIFNSGTYSAFNVVITVRMYDSQDTLLKSEEINLGTIFGKDYQTFDVDIYVYTKPDYITATLDWD